MESPTRSARLLEVDILRGVAALAVVFFHYTTQYERLFHHTSPPLFNVPWGYLGVNLFFMISGFVILMTLARTERPMDFVVSRFSRLYPVYWVAVLLTFTVTSIFGLHGKEVAWPIMLVNLTMVQGWFNLPSVDGVYWTLAIEMVFYCITFAMFTTRTLVHINTLVWALLALRLVYWVAEQVWGLSLPYIVFRFLLLGQIAYFGLGIALYHMHVARASLRKEQLLVVACLATIAVAESAGAMLIAGGLFALFASAVHGWPTWLRARPLVWLGTVSYPLYLVHENIGWVLLQRLEAAGVESNLAILLGLVVAAGLSTLLCYGVEKPAMHAIRSAWRKHRKSVSPA